ncbi:P1 family peptidase [Marinovum sp. 2_MG-2023]|uniref:P1 family peptidase n=1 Tax=unclassified Marinovum TaxID=2647166 RepID=UPI0026E47C6A|nr:MULTISPECIES: P1 family peptidase [unclassified Marinovum]MDO6730263.1 P1 family peptidase [Marinovum sp. 2_MG-2023]MDO6779001.1 P1 family peptidase [Marinovum sp. 1_MG-2023]
MTPGPRNLITDIAGLRVGNASDAALKSGCTVLVGDAPFVTSVAVMGGAPGTRETDLLAPDKMAPAVDALVLSGGSAFGLAAAQGVMDTLAEQGRGFAVGPARVPLVPAAILFDLLNGGNKAWASNPYPGLGKTALLAATHDFPLGTTGAGTGASTAMLKGGLGSASVLLDDGITVGALVAANPVGCVTTPGERHFWASPFEINGEFGQLGPDPAPTHRDLRHSRKLAAMAAQGNTTIAIVATDAQLTKAQAQRMATAAHDGIARAIVPAHTPMDGDLIFAASTGAQDLAAPDWQILNICHAAACCLSRAIARAIYHASPAPNDRMPCWSAANSTG